MKNLFIVIGFGIITISQLALGIVWTIIVAREGGAANPFACGGRSVAALAYLNNLVPVQRLRSHRYLLTHIAYVSFPGIGL